MEIRRNPGTAISLVLASHPVFSVMVALGVAAAAALSGRTTRELVLVLVTVLVGRMTAGWLNDVADNHNGVRSLPLRIALRTGAAKLLWLTCGYLALVTAGLIVAGLTVGLRQ